MHHPCRAAQLTALAPRAPPQMRSDPGPTTRSRRRTEDAEQKTMLVRRQLARARPRASSPVCAAVLRFGHTRLGFRGATLDPVADRYLMHADVQSALDIALDVNLPLDERMEAADIVVSYADDDKEGAECVTCCAGGCCASTSMAYDSCGHELLRCEV